MDRLGSAAKNHEGCDLQITPRKVDGVVKCPRSKGTSNRALLIAGLAQGTSRLKNVLASDDTQRMIEGLRSFGAEISESESVTVKGVDGKPSKPPQPVFCGNSGTTARFLAPVAAMSAPATITGNERMKQRPIKDLADALNKLGASAETSGCPPVKISGTLKGGSIEMNGSVSSQFVSALLMALPYAQKNSELAVKNLTSKPFVDLTLSVMKDFGACAERDGYERFFVAKGRYAGRSYFAEGDAANANYFFAAAAATEGRVKVTGINPESKQGEIKFVDVLERMGCLVKKGNDWISVEGNRLKGVDADMNSMPDAVQTLAVVAAFASGRTTIKNVENLRIKETDRISATAAQLRKIGAEVQEFKDGLTITPGPARPASVQTYDDHRMAMSFSVAALKIPGTNIENPECAAKTFPDFFEVLETL